MAARRRVHGRVATVLCLAAAARAFGPATTRLVATRRRRDDAAALRRRAAAGNDAPALAAGDDAPASAADDDTLTTAGFASMLAEVRAHYRKPFAADPGSDAATAEALRVKMRLLRTRFDGLRLRRCEARASAYHGRGLFATRDIGEGELCTLYPCDALLLWEKDAARTAGAELNALFGDHVSAEEQASPRLFLRSPGARDYEVPAAARLSIVGDPARDGDEAYLGHYANDGAAVVDPASRDAYAAASAAAANAEHVTMEGAHLGTVATRDIRSGDEILVSYGEGYWCSRAGLGAAAAPPSEPTTSFAPPTKTPPKARRRSRAKPKSKPEKGFG